MKFYPITEKTETVLKIFKILEAGGFGIGFLVKDNSKEMAGRRFGARFYHDGGTSFLGFHETERKALRELKKSARQTFTYNNARNDLKIARQLKTLLQKLS